MEQIKNKEPCKICGKVDKYNTKSFKYNMPLCRKHFIQLNIYGVITDKSSFLLTDKNKFTKLPEFYEIELRDKNYNIVGYALIDDCDYENCKNLKWYKDSEGYARTTIDGRKIRLHKYITNTDKNTLIDHINGEKLDCRRKNMRIASYSDNTVKSKIGKNNTSNIIGVYYWNNNDGYWVARFQYGEINHCKYFIEKEDAIIQRLYWELKYLKELAPQLITIKNKYNYIYNYIKEGKLDG